MNMKVARDLPRRQLHPLLGGGLAGAIGAILGFFVSQGLTLYTFQVSLRTGREIQMINLARDLDKEFVENVTFGAMRMSIDKCEKLYKNSGGKYNNDQINQYLNFFDDIGFYSTLHDLSDEIIDQMFGAYIVEAYEYPELQSYITEFHKNARQKKAFDNFEELAKRIEQDRDFADLVVAARACGNLNVPRKQN